MLRLVFCGGGAMPVSVSLTDDVVSGATSLLLSQFFTVSGTSEPAYLVVSALDRNEYTAGASGTTGAFVGKGATLGLTAEGGDARGAGIVFTWQGGQYVNATYGALSALDFTSSASAGDVTNISVFTAASLGAATQDAANVSALMQVDAAGYVGSATVVTDAHPFAAASGAPTPDRIAACADSFVGRAWNDNGCWILASTIAAESGAGLPVQSTAIGVAGHANGEWVMVYDGPVQASAAWQSLVTTGDIVDIGTPGGGGHITTCVSGTGGSAMLVDNITYVGANGAITNSAHDGSASDVLIAAAHPASQEWSGVQASSVVIYALDTPVVAAKAASAALALGGSSTLATLMSVSDPAAKAVTQVQAYAVGSAVSLVVGGKSVVAGSAAAAVTGASLAAIGVKAGSVAGTATLEVRAFNGTYWGDWQSETVKVGSGTAANSAVDLAAAAPVMALEDWLGSHVAVAPSAGWPEERAAGLGRGVTADVAAMPGMFHWAGGVHG
jgi:hypothetical protein